MAKKTTKEYSLEDYICGMSRDEFEENQLKLVEAKNDEYTERDTGCGFNLLREMNKIYKSVFVAEFFTPPKRTRNISVGSFIITSRGSTRSLCRRCRKQLCRGILPI